MSVPEPLIARARPKDTGVLQRMEHDEKMRLRRAAWEVKKLDLGPVGELLSRELLAFEEMGYRLASHALPLQLVEWVEARLREIP